MEKSPKDINIHGGTYHPILFVEDIVLRLPPRKKPDTAISQTA